jgi:hypothetical protein
MKKNRLTGIMTVVIAILLSFLLTACGPNGTGGNSDGGDTTPDVGGSPPDVGGTTPDVGGDGGGDGEIEYPYIGKTWGMAELIETDESEDASSPQIAFDSSGNAIAVWHQHDGSRNNIHANRFTAGEGWGTAERIETDDSGDASSPRVAFDPDGNAFAVWYQYNGSSYSILANRYVAGVGWDTAELIGIGDTGEVSSPRMAFDLDGNAIVVWHQYDGSRSNIYANKYVASVGWGAPEFIETDDRGDALYPQIAFESGGNAIAVWYQYDGSRRNIYANRYVAGAGWDTAELIGTGDTGEASSPQIAFDPDGDAIAVWHQYDGSRYSIYGNRYSVGVGWDAAGRIETDDTGDAFSPQIAFDSDGNAIAVWHQYDGSINNIHANRFVAGAGWGMAGLIETDDTGDASSPQVAFDPDGNAVAVWYQYDGSRNNIKANTYVADKGWRAAECIETEDSGNASSPQIAFDPDGNAIAVWYQYDGSRYSIYVNGYR